MNQCVQEQIENSNVQAVVEAIIFKKYSRSRKQISYLSQITIGEQQGFIVLEQEQIEQIITENLLTNRIEAYEYDLSWAIFQKELKYSFSQNGSQNGDQQGQNEEQKINQQEHEMNDIELDSIKANVSLQREQPIFSDCEGEIICEKNILNQDVLNDYQKENDAVENLRFIEDKNTQIGSKLNGDKSGNKELFNKQAQNQILNTESRCQESEVLQFQEKSQEQYKQNLTRTKSNSFNEENILNSEIQQIQNDNLGSIQENQKEQNLLQQDSQELQNKQDQSLNNINFLENSCQNEKQLRQLPQDSQELQSKQDQLSQNNIKTNNQLLKQDNYQSQQQSNQQQINLSQKNKQKSNEDSDNHSQQYFGNSKSPQIEVNIQEASDNQSKQLSNQNLSMSKHSGKSIEENSLEIDLNQQINQSNYFINLIDENSQQDKKEEVDSKFEDQQIADQQKSESRALSQRNEQIVVKNFELSIVKSEDAQFLIQSQDQFLVSQVQDTKVELESQTSELLNLIIQKEKRQTNAQMDQQFSQCQKRQLNQKQKENKQNNYDLNSTSNSLNVLSRNIQNQSISITLKNDQQIFKIPTQPHKVRQQNQNQSQKQKQVNKNNLCLIEIDQDDYICVENKNHKIIQKPKELTIQPSISEIDQFNSQESQDLFKKSQEQIKMTKQIGAMKYLVNELINKKQYGQFSKDKADIIINHKLNIREQHQDEVYTQFNITKCLYKVTWKKRPSGRIPQPSYYTFNELQQVAPRLLLEYLKKMATLKV
ncbi:hypothetical protein ABPG72_007774 [Tetrahymena utriculariae]